MRRRFNGGERVALYLSAGGKCMTCGVDLAPGWHADHVQPYVDGGATDVVNGQALCPACNLTKGSRTIMADLVLRDWQVEALDRLRRRPNFVAVATPGSGKTTFALAAAAAKLMDGEVLRVVVVVPTSHLRLQWANAASQFGIHLDYKFTNQFTTLATDYTGTVVTYQTIATQPQLWRKVCSDVPTLVILDEVHHAGDKENLAWGRALRHAFEPAARRILLSGTLFRTDGEPIPFVDYDQDRRCVPDFNYDYGTAIADGGVVRPIEFMALNGEMQWRNAGGVVTANLDSATSDEAAQALRAALHPDGRWIESVLRKADELLTRDRLAMPDAGGLVIATDIWAARRYAEKLQHITGEAPVIAVSDDPDASLNIARFSSGTSRWLVAVKMVSEGVDIPRLCVGVHGSTTTTEMFVRQVVGRFVRKRGASDAMSAKLFIPSVADLLAIAKRIEKSVDDAMLREAEREKREGKEPPPSRMFDLVESGEAIHHSTIIGGESFNDEELRRALTVMELSNIGDDRVSVAEVARMLLYAGMGRVVSTVAVPPPIAPVLKADAKQALRKLIDRKVGRLYHLGGGDYGHVNQRLNTACGIRKRAHATTEDLERMLELLDEWIEAAQ